MGFFDKIKQSLTRTKEQFVERFDEVVKRADEPARRTQPIDVETMEALEEALISADVGVAATEEIVKAVEARAAAGIRCARSSKKRSAKSCATPTLQCRTAIGRSRPDRRRERHRKDNDRRQACAG